MIAGVCDGGWRGGCVGCSHCVSISVSIVLYDKNLKWIISRKEVINFFSFAQTFSSKEKTWKLFSHYKQNYPYYLWGVYG